MSSTKDMRRLDLGGLFILIIAYLSTADDVSDLFLLLVVPYIEPPKDKNEADVSGIS